MNRRTFLISAIPAALLSFAVLLGIVLVRQVRAFERVHLEETRRELNQRTGFIRELILPDLRRGDWAAVDARIAFYHSKPFRITVLDRQGTVLADSDVNARTLGNHSDRPELASATDAPGYYTRYSETMGAPLLYHTQHVEHWVIRTSLPLSSITDSIHRVRAVLLLAVLMGFGLTGGIVALYLLIRVRPSLIAIQRTLMSITRGKQPEPIAVPSRGPMHTFCKAIAVLSRQLRLRIEELRRERNEFDALFNTMREPLLLILQTGEVLRANRAATKLFGKAILKHGYRIERTDCPELVETVRAAFHEPVVKGRELHYRVGGTTRELLAHAVRMEDAAAPSILLVLTDLTDLRRLEGIRSDFVANVSHEIKTPLTAILATVETLAEMPLDGQGRAKCLEILTRQARRLNDLVQDILSLAAIERRQTAPSRDVAPLRLDDVVTAAVALCSDEAERAGVALELAGPTPLPALTLRGDARLLEQCVVNLIGNALRHSGTARIEVGLTYADGRACLTVRDEGCGIPAEHLPRLFERFYRVDKDRSREHGGTGLGLAIVKHTAILHHGTVEVQSTPGQGTTFSLHLKAKNAE